MCFRVWMWIKAAPRDQRVYTYICFVLNTRDDLPLPFFHEQKVDRFFQKRLDGCFFFRRQKFQLLGHLRLEMPRDQSPAVAGRPVEPGGPGLGLRLWCADGWGFSCGERGRFGLPLENGLQRVSVCGHGEPPL
jgi:hypothetical protein